MKRTTYILLIYCILFLFSLSLNVKGATQDEIINNLQRVTQQLKNTIEHICPPNSYLKNGLCYCNEGLVWNENGTECITYNQFCQNKYGSHTYGDKNYCYCEEGYVWNKDKTKCITYDEDCSSLYGSHSIAGKGDTKNKYLCYCEEGYVWNKEKTKCITPAEWCLIEYNNDEHIEVYKEGDGYKCKCIDGYAWRNDLKKCVTYTEDCKLTYGDHVIGIKGDEKYADYCNCEEGYDWNLNKTECIPKFKVFFEYFKPENRDILLHSFILGFWPILIWIIVFALIIKSQLKKKLSLKRSLIFFGLGMLITPFVWHGESLYSKLLNINLNNLNNELSIGNLILGYLGITCIEELSKFAGAYLLLKKNKYFNEIINAMIYLIVLALGFGLVENFLAVTQDLTTSSWLMIALETLSLRFIGANLIHALSSGLIGFFWALTLVKGKKQYLFTGLILGILLHTFFNIAIIRLPESYGSLALYLISFTLFLITIILFTLLKSSLHLLNLSEESLESTNVVKQDNKTSSI
jgi:RsiW-degrading membrane proteinase PrsW (M82 family)